MASRPDRIVWHEAACPICSRTVRLSGREYNRRQIQTCGQPTCTRALHLQRDTVAAKASRLAANSKRRREAHAASPKTAGVETNASAKEWHLLSPDGTAYHFKNLALWLRKHADLFDPDDVAEHPQSKSGVSTRAQAALGKLRPERRSPKPSWKGWRWLHHKLREVGADV